MFYVLGDVSSYFSQIVQKRPLRLIVSEDWQGDTNLPLVRVKDPRATYLLDCEQFYQKQYSQFRWFGVTGTKGKSSICWWLSHALEFLGRKTAYIGTLGIRIGKDLRKSKNTSPGLQELNVLIKEFAANQVTDIVMEVSSQGLDQHRIPVSVFSCKVFTDLSEEHLDHHKTMEQYFLAKRRFFETGMATHFLLDRSLYAERIVPLAPERSVRYGLKQGFTLKDSLNGLQIQGPLSFKVPFTGFYNAENLLAVYEILRHFGYGEKEIVAAFENLPAVPGRMQKFIARTGALVFVDYAHSSEALEFVLASVRELHSKKLALVFGCGGDRDPRKRPRMGAAAAKYCDQVFVTSDNPRSEDPLKIISEIVAGMEGPAHRIVEPDRKKAIALAIETSGAGDVVLICGKGHEDYQIFADGTVPYSDLDEVAKWCQSIT